MNLRAEPGKIAGDLYLVGQGEMPLYLALGDRPAAFDSGFACLGPLYEEGLRSLLGNAGPHTLFLTHSHYDHVGSAAYLQKAFSGMEVACAEGAARVMEKPGAVATIEGLNEVAARLMRDHWGHPVPDIPFTPFTADRILKEGDRFSISPALTVEVLETPGHTRDCLSYYLPEIKALVSSEAAGIPDPSGHIYSDFLVDYDLYFASLEKLARYKVDILCIGHGGVLMGEEARNFVPDSIRQCKEFFDLVARVLDETHGDEAQTVQRVKAQEYDPQPEPKQPEPAYLLNLEARVRAVKKKLNG